MNQSPPNPFADLAKMFEQFKIPGVDMTAIVDARRKDIEALTKVNQAAYESMQAMARKQSEMLAQAMQGAQEAAKQAASGAGDPAKQTELARKAYEKAVADTKELAEIARKSQAEALAIVSQRATQQVEEFKKLMQPK